MLTNITALETLYFESLGKLDESIEKVSNFSIAAFDRVKSCYVHCQTIKSSVFL